MTDKMLEFYVLASDTRKIELRLETRAAWMHEPPYVVHSRPYGANGVQLIPRDMRSQVALLAVLNAKDMELYFDAFPVTGFRTAKEGGV